MTDYRAISYWLDSCGDDLTPRPALDQSIEVDIAIMGAGFSGLWTAWYLKQRDPSLRIAIIEREIAGFGASGRNGAWCTSEFPTGPDALAKHYGRDIARQTVFAMRETVQEIGRVAQDHGIDCDWANGGQLLIARGEHQRAAIDHEYAALQQLDLADGVEFLDQTAVQDRVHITDLKSGLFSPHTAVIHPGKLVRGLARLVETQGVTIYEQTAVHAVHGGQFPTLTTPSGNVRARTLVLCAEAYLSQLAGYQRDVMPVYSLITLTEPLSQADWDEIGWQHRECIASCRYTVDYLSRTADGRILFGGRGAPYRYGSRITSEMDKHAGTHQMLENNVRSWFPRLKDVRFTHTWGGPLGWSRDFMPTVAYDRTSNIALAHGYTGNGVATTNLAARTLTDLITGVDSPLLQLPHANHKTRKWEPEPFRWLGVRYMQQAFMKLDRQAEATGIAPKGTSLAERMTAH
ncbi:MAG TPA: FAD-binding oxidoreductase [Thermomicrobiales bacterium]|nr:FAD-binding oxidoreductase [Thermomicrobiales bacterium]